MNSHRSAQKIPAFIAYHRLDMDEVEEQDITRYRCFNDFFFRKLVPGSRPVCEPANNRRLISPADSRLLVFPLVSDATHVWIKARGFSLASLLGSEELAQRYHGGSMAIARLAPQDYHRYHSPVAGRWRVVKDIDGHYHSVNPLAVRCDINVFGENRRSIGEVDSAEFGRVLYIPVGATMVGSINYSVPDGAMLSRGDELGWFAFGGSTIILLFERGRVCFDRDLRVASAKPIETLVKVGDGIGMAQS